MTMQGRRITVNTNNIKGYFVRQPYVSFPFSSYIIIKVLLQADCFYAMKEFRSYFKLCLKDKDLRTRETSVIFLCIAFQHEHVFLYYTEGAINGGDNQGETR